jgi:hypothetical protein
VSRVAFALTYRAIRQPAHRAAQERFQARFLDHSMPHQHQEQGSVASAPDTHQESLPHGAVGRGHPGVAGGSIAPSLPFALRRWLALAWHYASALRLSNSELKRGLSQPISRMSQTVNTKPDASAGAGMFRET